MLLPADLTNRLQINRTSNYPPHLTHTTFPNDRSMSSNHFTSVCRASMRESLSTHRATITACVDDLLDFFPNVCGFHFYSFPNC
jgi:hypothetical protein